MPKRPFIRNKATNIFGFFVLIITFQICSAQQSKTLQIENGTLHFKIYGTGYPILIINGGPGFNSNGFESLAEKFAELGYSAITFDQRGTGLSKLNKIDSSTINMSLMADDIETIRKELGIKNWVVFGHSFGGMLGSYYVSKYPKMVSGLILSSSGGLDLALLENSQENLFKYLDEKDQDSILYYRLQRNRYPNNSEIRKAYSRILAKAYVKNSNLIPKVAERLSESNMAINGLVWSSLRQIEYDVKDELKNFNGPVLILHGDEDIVPLEVAKKADSVFHNTKLVLLRNSRHYGWLDAPDVYFSEIEEFMKMIK